MGQRPFDDIGAEFENASLGDKRRSDRWKQLGERMAQAPGDSFPDVLPPAELEAAYRLLNNPALSTEALVGPHVAQSVARVSRESTVLVAHDSSVISYSSGEGREGLAGTPGAKQKFLAHCSLALTADERRMPLGVLALSYHVPIKTPGVKLSGRWRDHVISTYGAGLGREQLVHLMDREADVYELLDFLTGIGARFVVRAKARRKTKDGSVLKKLQQADAIVERSVAISRRKNTRKDNKQSRIHPDRDARMARLSITSCEIELPRTAKADPSGRESITVNAVRAWEENPPEGQQPVDWLLYTSEAITSGEEVLQVVDWYRARWRIEEYFKALKTGCAVERRQFQDFHSLTNAMTLFVPIAWKILLLSSQSQENPDADAKTVLEEDEVEVLRRISRTPLPQKPTVRQATLAIAALGGHLKHNGKPGWQTLARGYEKLAARVEGWRLACSTPGGKPPG